MGHSGDGPHDGMAEPPASRGAKALTVRLSPILSDALASVKPGEGTDEALPRARKARHPEQAAALLSAVTRIVEIESGRAGEDKQATLRRLAQEDPGPEITLRTSAGHGFDQGGYLQGDTDRG